MLPGLSHYWHHHYFSAFKSIDILLVVYFHSFYQYEIIEICISRLKSYTHSSIKIRNGTTCGFKHTNSFFFLLEMKKPTSYLTKQVSVCRSINNNEPMFTPVRFLTFCCSNNGMRTLRNAGCRSYFFMRTMNEMYEPGTLGYIKIF